MKLSQIWAMDAPTTQLSHMSEQQLLDMELGIFVENTVGKNPERLLIELETNEKYLNNQYFELAEKYER